MVTVIRWTQGDAQDEGDFATPAGRDADAVVPVPLKPTAPMLASGARAGDVSVETAWKIYMAMLRSTPA